MAYSDILVAASTWGANSYKFPTTQIKDACFALKFSQNKKIFGRNSVFLKNSFPTKKFRRAKNLGMEHCPPVTRPVILGSKGCINPRRDNCTLTPQSIKAGIERLPARRMRGSIHRWVNPRNVTTGNFWRIIGAIR